LALYPIEILHGGGATIQQGVYKYTLRKKVNPHALQKIVKSQDDKE
jgi:hypothetical protein